MKQFSVLMSVYRNDNPIHLRVAVESISIKQTLQPDEIFIYVDGEVPDELANTIKQLQSEIPTITVHWEKENKGLGIALQYGMLHVKHEIVARMDADDISVPDRFEKQMKFLSENTDVSIVGGQISEFVDNSNNIVGKRIVPCSSTEVNQMIKRRCPLNHMTVTMRRSHILKCGNYQDWFWNEDFYLWIRMHLVGYKIENVPDTLVNVRVGTDMYARRGSIKYFKSEEGLQRYMLKHKMINIFEYLFNTSIRFVVQVVLPNKLRAFIFQKLFRKQ